MDLIYKRFDGSQTAGWIICFIIAAFILFLLIFIIVKEIKAHKRGDYVSWEKILAMIIPVILGALLCAGQIFDIITYKRFTAGDYNSVTGEYKLIEEYRNSAGITHYTFSVGDTVFESIKGSEGKAVKRIEDGTNVMIIYAESDKGFADWRLVILEIYAESEPTETGP